MLKRRDFLALAAMPACGAPAARFSRFVHPGRGGRLVYEPGPRGDTIPDFSDAGYMGGGVDRPRVRVAAFVNPAPGDATARIQAAIDKVSAMPVLRAGVRGAVLLQKGEHRVAGTLVIRATGVVLQGDPAGGTVLVATGRKKRSVIEIRGEGGPKTSGPTRRVMDDYVPVGARSFRVDPAQGLRPGDAVIVRRHGNQEWIRAIAMDRITPRPGDPNNTRQWTPFSLEFDRVITAVEGSRITVDAPITCAIEARWGGGDVAPYTDAGRINSVAVEHIRAVSDYDRNVRAEYRGERYFSDENHAWTLVSIDAAVNAWARNLHAVHFGFACVQVGRAAKWVTVEDSTCTEMVSVVTGSRRYPYSINGQLCLVQHCSADTARHDFAIGSRVCGPNVFLDCAAGKSYATSEPHHRWSVGGLFDNVKASIAVQDRQWMGTGHGWAGANYVVWNCEGPLVLQQPPTAQNWAIGQVGEKLPGAFPRPDGFWDSFGAHVLPRSLYEKQLDDRLAERARRK